MVLRLICAVATARAKNTFVGSESSIHDLLIWDFVFARL